MSMLPLAVFSGFLLALMVGLRKTAPTVPNADLLLAAMRDFLEDICNSKGRTP